MASKNFKYLDELIHSGAKEIVLDSDIVLSDGEESEYQEGIMLDIDELAIDGNGYAIDAKGKTRLFQCTGKNITVKNIILKKGYAREKGGAIFNTGNLTIAESTLNNNVTDWCGGAIFNTGKLTITESALNNNKSSTGGALNSNGELTIIKSTLNNNAAEWEGGAIYNDGGKLKIAESTFSGNAVNFSGGAIYNDHGSLSLTESSLQENTAQHIGVINNWKDPLKRTTEDLVGVNTSGGDGGAIYNKGKLTIAESTLNNNTSECYGGAIDNIFGKLTITDSTLNHNTAQKVGGAIRNLDAKLTITCSTLTGNTAQVYGGAISLEKSKYNSKKCTFKDNEPDDVYKNSKLFTKLMLLIEEFVGKVSK